MDNVQFKKDLLIETLKNEGIDTRSFFYPLNIQKAFQKYGKQDCPNAESLGKRGFYLPSGQTLTTNHINRVVETRSRLLRK